MRIGLTIAASPRMNQRLKILEPITFPTERFPLSPKAAIAERKSSGAEVPNATIVNPISAVETLKNFAILTEEFTKKSEE